MNNKLIIAAAGSGKTTCLIEETMNIKDGYVLITTYTENNVDEIKNKFVSKYKCVPSHVTIQTWFSFLIQHGVKPYQGTFNELLFDVSIRGMVFVDDNQGKSPVKINDKTIYLPLKEETHFKKHYLSDLLKIYSDRLPKFVYKSNEATDGEIINRISRMYKYIFVDEVQDLAGYDLEIIKLLLDSPSTILLVEDPRQVTYLTHHETKLNKYKNGKIEDFINIECKKQNVEIDKNTLKVSHRNNKMVCDFSSKLYPEFEITLPCDCEQCRKYVIEHEGVFLVKPYDVDSYLKKINPVQLRWNRIKEVNDKYPVFNFGESKGKTFDNVLIYPTEDMEKWIIDHKYKLAYETRAKFYVAITRAKYSVAIICDYPNNTNLDGIQLYNLGFKT